MAADQLARCKKRLSAATHAGWSASHRATRRSGLSMPLEMRLAFSLASTMAHVARSMCSIERIQFDPTPDAAKRRFAGRNRGSRHAERLILKRGVSERPGPAKHGRYSIGEAPPASWPDPIAVLRELLRLEMHASRSTFSSATDGRTTRVSWAQAKEGPRGFNTTPSRVSQRGRRC